MKRPAITNGGSMRLYQNKSINPALRIPQKSGNKLFFPLFRNATLDKWGALQTRLAVPDHPPHLRSNHFSCVAFITLFPRATRLRLLSCASTYSEERSDPRRESPMPKFVPVISPVCRLYIFCQRGSRSVTSRTRASEFSEERSDPRRETPLNQD